MIKISKDKRTIFSRVKVKIGKYSHEKMKRALTWVHIATSIVFMFLLGMTESTQCVCLGYFLWLLFPQKVYFSLWKQFLQSYPTYVDIFSLIIKFKHLFESCKDLIRSNWMRILLRYLSFRRFISRSKKKSEYLIFFVSYTQYWIEY